MEHRISERSEKTKVRERDAQTLSCTKGPPVAGAAGSSSPEIAVPAWVRRVAHMHDLLSKLERQKRAVGGLARGDEHGEGVYERHAGQLVPLADRAGVELRGENFR